MIQPRVLGRAINRPRVPRRRNSQRACREGEAARSAGLGARRASAADDHKPNLMKYAYYITLSHFCWCRLEELDAERAQLRAAAVIYVSEQSMGCQSQGGGVLSSLPRANSADVSPDIAESRWAFGCGPAIYPLSFRVAFPAISAFSVLGRMTARLRQGSGRLHSDPRTIRHRDRRARGHRRDLSHGDLHGRRTISYVRGRGIGSHRSDGERRGKTHRGQASADFR